MSRRVIIAVVASTLSLAMPASAETWKAGLVLIAERSAKTCVADVTQLFWDMKIEGTTFSGTSTQGASFSTSVAPDGSIKAKYMGKYGTNVFPVELTGNVKSKQLELVNPQADCRYKVLPVNSVATADAASTQICDLRVDYAQAKNPPPDVNGIWQGAISFGGDLPVCVGFVIEGDGPNGTIKAKYAWNSSVAGSGVRGTNKIGVTDAIIIRTQNSGYKIGKISVTRTNATRLDGTWENDSGHRYPVFYERMNVRAQ